MTAKQLGVSIPTLKHLAAGIGAAFVVVMGFLLRRRHTATAH